jgi:hypothetical protein
VAYSSHLSNTGGRDEEDHSPRLAQKKKEKIVYKILSQPKIWHDDTHTCHPIYQLQLEALNRRTIPQAGLGQK